MNDLLRAQQYPPTNELPELCISFHVGRLVLLLAGAILFVVAGGWLIYQAMVDFVFVSVLLITLGVAGLLFFGICALSIGVRLFRHTSALILDAEGLIDHSGGASAGRVYWAAITDVRILTVQRQRFILFEVQHPCDFIQREPHWLKRQMMALNNRYYGTPIQISANALNISLDELYQQVMLRWEHSEPIRS